MQVSIRACSPIRWMSYAKAFNVTINLDDLPMRGALFVDLSDLEGSTRTSIGRLFTQYWVRPETGGKVVLGCPPCDRDDIEQIVTHIKNHFAVS